MSNRDDFSAKTKRTLAARVGHHCSNPGCGRSTLGPALEEGRFINIGKAAHITAAASGGKRYDASLSPEERRADTNGIWLCGLCADLIDKDEKRFTLELLRKWKSDAVANALKDVATSAPRNYQSAAIELELDDDDDAFLRSLSLSAEDSVNDVARRLREATERDVAAFRSTKDWPAHTIMLNLTLHASDGRHSISLEGMASGTGVGEPLNLVAAPGMGKTTTQVELAAKLLQIGQSVPALVPLGEWSDRLEDFFSFLARRSAYRAFRPQHFAQMAYHGRLVLLLDGWNELHPDSRVRATRDLKALRRDYPLLGIVIGTRRQQLPISGPAVEIELLSEQQQIELARAVRGFEGEALVDQAWRTPGVRELISIPLYLNALLRSTPGARFPRTKEEVLRLFVTQHEESPEKAEILRKELHGFHGDMLVGLALEANRTANTAISDTNARRVISNVESRLSAEGQLSAPPQPGTVIDVLVNGHVLVRSLDGSISFQHQQFQEWYASGEVERLMIQAAIGDTAARTTLRVDILNWPSWEESILFACERVSRENATGAKAVAAAIKDALTIDPMLAAEMIFRSSAEVWPQISAEVLRFATRWHTPGKADRAARFTMMTGRQEFADLIWPLIASADNQVYLSALRAPPRFRPSVLGGDAEAKLSALGDHTRPHVVAEIAGDSGFDGMELAVRVAKADPSPVVVVEVLQALQFRRADRFVREIMEEAGSEVWELVAQKGYPDVLADPAQNARLLELQESQLRAETSPIQVLSNLTQHAADSEESRARITARVASRDFPTRDDRASMILRRAFERFPEAVQAGLLQRIAEGVELPYDAAELLKSAPAVDDGRVASAAIDRAIPERVARGAFAVIGPKTVGTLIDQFVALQDKRERIERSQADRQAWSNEYQRIRDAIGASRTDSFIPALLARADSSSPQRIEWLADLLAWHGRRDEAEPPADLGEARPAVLATIQRWIDTLLESPQANRHHFAHVVNAIARFPDPQFVPGLERMLCRDLADWSKAREEFRKNPRRGPTSPDVSHSHTIEYQRTFAAIGNRTAIEILKRYLPDLQFGMQAAGALFQIWAKENPLNKERRLSSWHDYSRARPLHRLRRDAPETLGTCEFAEWIFEVVRSLGIATADGAGQRHALALAVAGLGLPHGTKRADIDALMALPVPFEAKQRLLMAAAMAGEIVPATALVAGLQELLEIGKTRSYRLSENHGEVMGWVELFAFSDRPEKVLAVIDTLPDEYRRYSRGLERLIEALGQSPHEDALEVLQALGAQNPAMFADHSWLNAVMKLDTEDSTRALLALVGDGQVGNTRGADSHQLRHHLVNQAQRFPAIMEELLRRYREMRAGQPKAIVESILVEIADTAIIQALIDGYAADGRAYDGGLSQAVRKVALGQRAVEGWGTGSYEEFSVSLASFRKQLFALAVGVGPKAALAERCLVAIERLRDEHGRIADEPRHPDIASGRRWPLIQTS